MQILRKNEYYEIILDAQQSLIIHKALPGTSKMSTEEFKDEMIAFAEMCEKYLPEKNLAHLIDMRYSIIPEEQEWVNAVAFPRFVNIVKRMAILMPTSIFENIAVQQTMDENTGLKFVQMYFDDERKALDWLLQ